MAGENIWVPHNEGRRMELSMDAGLIAVSVEVTEDELKVELLDGRTIIVPLAVVSTALHAKPARRGLEDRRRGIWYSLARHRRRSERGRALPRRSLLASFSNLISLHGLSISPCASVSACQDGRGPGQPRSPVGREDVRRNEIPDRTACYTGVDHCRSSSDLLQVRLRWSLMGCC